MNRLTEKQIEYITQLEVELALTGGGVNAVDRDLRLNSFASYVLRLCEQGLCTIVSVDGDTDNTCVRFRSPLRVIQLFIYAPDNSTPEKVGIYQSRFSDEDLKAIKEIFRQQRSSSHD